MLFSSFGVKGFRIDLLKGNRWQALLEKELVFEPKPNIGKFKTF